MAYIKGYFFGSKTAANNAVKQINQGEGIPAFIDSITQSYCEPINCKGGYYIIYDELTSKYLTEVVEIEIEIPKLKWI